MTIRASPQTPTSARAERVAAQSTYDALKLGAAHNPDEFVLAPSLRARAEVALALAAEVLADS